MTPDPITRAELENLIGQFELRIERRLGVIESDLREAKSRMLSRNGPIIDELHRFQEQQTELRGLVEEARKRLEDVPGRGETRDIARTVFDERGSGQRSLTDFSMRVVMFAVSLGTLIFVLKGPG